MTPNKNKIITTCLLSGLALLSLVSAAQADSARIKWIGNGHYYQLLYTPILTWFDAQKSCQQKGAHLATITSVAENSFIFSKQIGVWNTPFNYNSYWIGASDSSKEGTHNWVNNEKFDYKNWYSAQWDSLGSYTLYLYGAGGKWQDAPANSVNAYLCEWSNHNFVDVTSVPDINNNKFSETAALYVDFVSGKHTVKIKDPQTQTVLSTLTFLTSFNPPQGLVAIADLNGNKVPEIAVLYSELNQPSVGIKDAKTNGALLKTLRFLGTGYEPKAITATPDTNGNGSSEITVLGINKTTGAAKSETRDSKTGAILKSIAF